MIRRSFDAALAARPLLEIGDPIWLRLVVALGGGPMLDQTFDFRLTEPRSPEHLAAIRDRIVRQRG